MVNANKCIFTKIATYSYTKEYYEKDFFLLLIVVLVLSSCKKEESAKLWTIDVFIKIIDSMEKLQAKNICRDKKINLE